MTSYDSGYFISSHFIITDVDINNSYIFSILSLLEFSTTLKDVDSRIVNLAAVYWSDNLIDDGGMYTRWIPDLTADGVSAEMRDAISQVYADASWAYIVTWHLMRPNGGTTYANDVSCATIRILYFSSDLE